MNKLNEVDLILRQSFADLTVQGDNPFQKLMYEKWDEYRELYFNNAPMIHPVIELENPSTPSVYGSYCQRNQSGITAKINIRPSLLTGTHPHIIESAPVEGRNRFVLDVLLHEMIHQYNHEILGKPEKTYHGHGPTFRDQCNRIGQILNLENVRSSKKRGPDKELPSCAQWPHCTRPTDYYLGAFSPDQNLVTVSTKVPKQLAPIISQELQMIVDRYCQFSSVPQEIESTKLNP